MKKSVKQQNIKLFCCFFGYYFNQICWIIFLLFNYGQKPLAATTLSTHIFLFFVFSLLHFSLERWLQKMAKKIIYSTRPFRETFVEKIAALAPDYEFKTELQAGDFENVEISLGWDSEHQDQLLQSPSLKWVQAISAGVDYLPLKQFAEKKILLSNGSGIHQDSIAEHVLGIIFGISRGLFQSSREQANHRWNPESIHYQSITDQNLLIIGTGHIGTRLAQKAASLGINVYGVNTTGHPAENIEKTYPLEQLKDILPNMDIVVNILPLTEKTHHLFNQELFQFFARQALFINVGRGASVKTDDLVTALSEQQFAFAALDVFEEEPLAEDHPLWDMENVLITPHIAGLTAHFQQKLMAIFLENLKEYTTRQMITRNNVDLNAGY
jgi:phosphoglycerate dehydrogenase-like enzyme